MGKAKVAEAIRITFDRRGTHAVPTALPQPPTGWQKPYDALAKECGPNVGLTLDAWHWYHAGGTVADILAAIGEVAYRWEIASDALAWTANACRVLNISDPATIANGRAFARLVDRGGLAVHRSLRYRLGY